MAGRIPSFTAPGDHDDRTARVAGRGEALYHRGMRRLTLLAFAALAACSSSNETSPGTGGNGTGGAGTGGSGGSGGSATGGSGGVADPFACVGSVVWPAGPDTDVHVTGVLTELPSALPLDAADVSACDTSDPHCKFPYGMALTDATGAYDVVTYAGVDGFRGYILVEKTGLMNDLIYWLPPIVADKTGHDFQEVGDTVFESLLIQAGVTRDFARGHIAVTALDCAGHPAAGVTLAIDAGDASTVLLYSDAGALTQGLAATDGTGFALFANVPLPAGNLATVTASRNGTTIATFAVAMDGDSVTSLFLPPTP